MSLLSAASGTARDVYRSDDGAQTFAKIGALATSSFVTGWARNPVTKTLFAVNGKAIARSVDNGATWTETTVNTPSQVIYLPKYNRLVVMAEDNAVVYLSNSDGTGTGTGPYSAGMTYAWGYVNLPNSGSLLTRAMAYDPDADRLVIITAYDTNGYKSCHAFVSTDGGVTWTASTNNIASGVQGSPKANSLAWNKPLGKFVMYAVAGGVGISAVSADGMTWTSNTSTGAAVYCYALAVSPSGVMAFCTQGYGYWSSDGLIWKQSPSLGGANTYFYAFAWSPERGGFVGLGYNGQRVHTNADATTWTVDTALTNVQYSAFGNITFNQPPNAPGLTSPANNATIDRGVAQRFAWTFSDPDAGDSQSKFDLQYRTVGGSTWTSVTGTTPNAYWDATAGTFPAGNYEWQVRTYDSQGAQGPWSASSFFAAADAPVGAVIVAPASGGTVSSSATVTWSAPNLTDYQVRRVKDNAGAADTSTIYYDSGDVVDSTTRSVALTFDTNNRYEHLQVRIKYNGLWSAWSSIRVLVSYSPPPAPAFTVDLDDVSGSLLLTITNPTPTGSEPATPYNDVEIDDGDGFERKATYVTANGTWRYWTPVALRDYAGAIRVTAVGTNGTTASTTNPVSVSSGGTPVQNYPIVSGGSPS